jgi:hypothetical protein
MPILPEYATPIFDAFLKQLSAATGDDGKTPLVVDVVDDEGAISIGWDDQDPRMEYMTLLSEKAVSLFITEMMRRAYEQVDDMSMETTTEEVSE